MKTFKSVLLAVCLVTLAGSAYALPTFQTYVPGSTAGSYGPDQHTWYSGANPFTLLVLGAYGPNTVSITGVTLLISVPDGETGTISISADADDPTDVPVLLTTTGAGTGSPYTNPTLDADISVLTDVSGLDGYSTKDFLPTNFNNHYPLKNNISDFLIFGIGDFNRDSTDSTGSDYGELKDYNADGGTISDAFNADGKVKADGEVKEYAIGFTGFSQIHIDAYGVVTDDHGNKNHSTTWDWDINPGSHDATVVPEPSTLLLLGGGLVGLRFVRRRMNGSRNSRLS